MLTPRNDIVYGSTKTYVAATGLSCCFRQWRAQSHCRFLHGYAISVYLRFEATTLDENNWVMDFGALKPIKKWLEDTFDHKTLVAADDPGYAVLQNLADIGLIQMVTIPTVGCEGCSRMIYDHVEAWLKHTEHYPRVRLVEVEVREHEGNSAYTRQK